VAIGDLVRFDPGEGGTGMIKEVLPRRNKISRRASGTSRKEQVLAANIDQALPVFATDEPSPDWELLDRMLAIAQWQEIPAVICINKMDLATGDDLSPRLKVYEEIGYRVICTSIITDQGKEDFRELLKNRTSLFMGPSGVGKSSLLNWQQPGLKIRTGEVSVSTGEGRHTTSHTELVELSAGGFVGDLPGVREFFLWDMEPEDIPGLFIEFLELQGECQFRNCSHVHEPSCIVREAVDEGKVDRLRYQSYLQLRQRP
jgi:ribosome biogenesis GTPase